MRGKKDKPGKRKVRTMGTVSESLPGANFAVKLDDGCRILAYLPGKIRRQRTTILPGDRVRVELLPHEREWGRIVPRQRWSVPEPIRRLVIRFLERKPT